MSMFSQARACGVDPNDGEGRDYHYLSMQSSTCKCGHKNHFHCSITHGCLVETGDGYGKYKICDCEKFTPQWKETEDV